MFKFNNTHIFTGYLKQLLSSVNLPTCRIYTRDFVKYAAEHPGHEDPRVLESFNSTHKSFVTQNALQFPYLKDNELYSYLWNYDTRKPLSNYSSLHWKKASSVFYEDNKHVPGLTRVLNSPGNTYDTVTHEYLGNYLRFLRDLYGVNLMSLYNCFNNKICNNIYYRHEISRQPIQKINPNYDNTKPTDNTNKPYIDTYKITYNIFNSQDSKYRIYAFPVKLFANYTIAIDSSFGIELFCGFYNTTLSTDKKSVDLITKTYKKVNSTHFKQPFLYDLLDVSKWNTDTNSLTNEGSASLFNNDIINRWDIAQREQDLKLFIRVPSSCKSSIVILEGDYRYFNDFRYVPKPLKILNPNYDEQLGDTADNPRYITSSNDNELWEYKQNHVAMNFGNEIDLNISTFKPISKVQLLEFNTGESYPFADRLVEYLSKSAITPLDEIPDNIKRAQEVMKQNKHYFKINGLWEDKMQKIIYDYIMNFGPVKIENGVLINRHSGHNPAYYGYQPKLGHNYKSTLYDILGYVDKDAEKWYASWTKDSDNKVKLQDNIQNVDIYNGIFDI